MAYKGKYGKSEEKSYKDRGGRDEGRDRDDRDRSRRRRGGDDDSPFKRLTALFESQKKNGTYSVRVNEDLLDALEKLQVGGRLGVSDLGVRKLKNGDRVAMFGLWYTEPDGGEGRDEGR